MVQSVTSAAVLCTVIIAFSSIVIQMRDVPPLNDYISKNISSAKPYATFEEFYPHYLGEHTLKSTRQWHYVGTTLFLLYLLFNPTLSIPMIAGGLAAYAIIPYARHLSTGIAEVLVFPHYLFHQRETPN